MKFSRIDRTVFGFALLAFALVFTLLTSTGCGTTRYEETLDPTTGAVVGRKLKLGADINVLTSGDLSNTGGSSGGGFLAGLIGGGGNRTSVATQTPVTAFADPSRPTLRAGELEIYGAVNHSAPIAATGRSVTGALAEIRKAWVRVTGLQAWEADALSSHQTDRARIASDAAVDQAEIDAATRAAEIAAERDIALETIAAQ